MHRQLGLDFQNEVLQAKTICAIYIYVVHFKYVHVCTICIQYTPFYLKERAYKNN